MEEQRSDKGAYRGISGLLCKNNEDMASVYHDLREEEKAL